VLNKVCNSDDEFSNLNFIHRNKIIHRISEELIKFNFTFKEKMVPVSTYNYSKVEILKNHKTVDKLQQSVGKNENEENYSEEFILFENNNFKYNNNMNMSYEEFQNIKKGCFISNIEDGEVIMYHCFHCKVESEIDEMYDSS